MSEYIEFIAKVEANTVDDNLLELVENNEIIRCRDCKFKSLYDGETKYYYCALEDRPNRQWSVDDWNYCYWGERKEHSNGTMERDKRL